LLGTFAYNADSSLIFSMTDSLQKIFGSQARLKLLRLFLFNPQHSFTASEAATRAQLDPAETRSELTNLVASTLIRKNRRGKLTKYEVNAAFPYLLALQNLLLNVTSRGEEVKQRLRRVGPIRLIVITGMFMGEWEANLDLLVVGDRVKERTLKKQVKQLEAEIGKEIRYTLLPNQDFLYRLNMNDKLLRDIFDFPHRIVLDKFDIGLK
jgi:hypothetical protein